MRTRRLVVIVAAGLSAVHLRQKEILPNLTSMISNGALYQISPVFPSVALVAQASLTTGRYPEAHGIVSNGLFLRDRYKVSFGGQASSLVLSDRVWDRLKAKNNALRCACLFMHNTLYAGCDAVITPKPIRTDEGFIPWCYSKPPGLYEKISADIGPFNPLNHWGPTASAASTSWIAGCAAAVSSILKPDLMFVRLPHLDYASQRLGPDHPSIKNDLASLDREVGRIRDSFASDSAVFMVLSEYTYSSVAGDIPVNRILRENGLLKVREIQGREYPDLETTPAFAVADRQVAHVYIKQGHIAATLRVLAETDGIEAVLGTEGKEAMRVEHPRSGELVAVSSKDRWFSYYYWLDEDKAPGFASRAGARGKPGYDPLELFAETGTFKVPMDTRLIKGSHGRVGEADRLPLIISGALQRWDIGPDELSLVDVAGLIESILLNLS